MHLSVILFKQLLAIYVLNDTLRPKMEAQFDLDFKKIFFKNQYLKKEKRRASSAQKSRPSHARTV